MDWIQDRDFVIPRNTQVGPVQAVEEAPGPGKLRGKRRPLDQIPGNYDQVGLQTPDTPFQRRDSIPPDRRTKVQIGDVNKETQEQSFKEGASARTGQTEEPRRQTLGKDRPGAWRSGNSLRVGGKLKAVYHAPWTAANPRRTAKPQPRARPMKMLAFFLGAWVAGILLACLPSPAEAKTAKIKVDLANIREGPDTKMARVGRAKRGTELAVLGEKDQWLKVELPDGQQGWIWASLVTITDAAPTPAPPATPRATPSLDDLRGMAAKLAAGQIKNLRTAQTFWILQEAVTSAQTGDRLLLGPGRYPGRLVIGKELRLFGAGMDESIIELDRDKQDSVWIQAACPKAIFAHVTFLGGKGKLPLVEINGAFKGLLTHCRFKGGKGVALAIGDRATPTIANCEFIKTGKVAIEVRGQAAPLLELNQASDGQGGGIVVFDSAAPIIRGNRIHGMNAFGIQVADRSRPILESNVVENCRLDGIYVQHLAAPTIRGNSILSNAQNRRDTANLSFDDDSAGIVEENVIAGAERRPGLLVIKNAHPLVQRNQFFRNKIAIRLEDKSYPTLRENHLVDNGDDLQDKRDK